MLVQVYDNMLYTILHVSQLNSHTWPDTTSIKLSCVILTPLHVSTEVCNFCNFCLSFLHLKEFKIA